MKKTTTEEACVCRCRRVKKKKARWFCYNNTRGFITEAKRIIVLFYTGEAIPGFSDTPPPTTSTTTTTRTTKKKKREKREFY